MNRSTLHRSALAAALALAFLPAAAFAAMPATSVQASLRGEGIELRPAINAPAYHLRASGPDGRVFEDTFLPSETMRLEPRHFGLAQWAEGSYRYEVTAVLGDRNRGDARQAKIALDQPAPAAASGTFSVFAGQPHVANPRSETELAAERLAKAGGPTITPQDVVNADDVIVQGSLCVGLDCVANESFGFDTIRLKENNTRIKFEDTSSAAGFVTTDWQLTANDSASGGASKFSIENITDARVPFTVLGGAPTNALFVSNLGDLGLGTAVPVLDLHITRTDTPAVRFEQTSAGGFTAQTWDVAGNEANFFIRDVTSGSRLPFRIRPGAPTSSIDINAVGNVGIGTASPATALHLSRGGTADVAFRIQRTGGVAASWDIANVDTGRLNFTDDPTGARVPVKFTRLADNNLFRVGHLASNTVDVNGNLVVTGNIQVAGTVGPDYVFAPNFDLPSIREHAEQMFANRHLPKVGPAMVNEAGEGLINLGQISHGMLEELEYAHIYISQLDGTVQSLKQELAERDAEMAAMRAEIEAIRKAVTGD